MQYCLSNVDGPPGTRRLTVGERGMLHLVFGNSLLYDRLLVGSVDKKKMDDAGYVALAIGRAALFNSHDYRPDFCRELSAWRQALFVHECAHVWQEQHGISARLRFCDLLRLVFGHPVASGYSFTRTQVRGRPGNPGHRRRRRVFSLPKFEDLNHEQQALLFADYYLVKKGLPPRQLENADSFPQNELLRHYTEILAPVLADPTAYVCRPGDSAWENSWGGGVTMVRSQRIE